MSDLSEDKTEKTNRTKELVKKMNVDAVANVLINMQIDNYKVKSEQANLKHIMLKAIQDISSLKAEISMLKVMGLRGNMGTGSTVHKQGE
jgi:hypothetical protein